MNIKNKLYMSAGLSIILVVIGISVVGCQEQPEKYTGPVEKVRLGLGLSKAFALGMIAEDRGYFEEEGLDIEIKEYPSGKRALVDGLLAGEVDVATTADVPIVFNTFERNDFSIITSISLVDSAYEIVARRDSDIATPSDLKGKRIATQKGSGVQFFLHNFLIINGLSESDIELSFKNAEELPAALVSGEIDAFSMREPYTSQAKELLGDNAVVFSEKGTYLATGTLVAFNNFIEERPEAVKKIIRALIKAEEFVRENQDQAIEIVANRIGTDKSELEAFWPDINLKISLEQSLLVTLEAEARWAIKNKLTDKTEVPNYLDYIYFDALEEVKPEAVGIIR